MINTQDHYLDFLHGDDWLDLRLGDRALVRGKSTRNRQGDTLLTLTQPDWSVTAIDVPDPQGLLFDIPDIITLIVTVKRTEDGLEAVEMTFEKEPE